MNRTIYQISDVIYPSSRDLPRLCLSGTQSIYSIFKMGCLEHHLQCYQILIVEFFWSLLISQQQLFDTPVYYLPETVCQMPS